MSQKLFLISNICWFALGLWIGCSVLGGQSERKFMLFSIMKELRQGMSRDEVTIILTRHYAPYIKIRTSPDDVILVIKTLPGNYLELFMHFDQDKLVNAGFMGEDGPHDIPDDAPKFEGINLR